AAVWFLRGRLLIRSPLHSHRKAASEQNFHLNPCPNLRYRLCLPANAALVQRSCRRHLGDLHLPFINAEILECAHIPATRRFASDSKVKMRCHCSLLQDGQNYKAFGIFVTVPILYCHLSVFLGWLLNAIVAAEGISLRWVDWVPFFKHC
ncbi:MAG: hypothetical protein ABR912_14235, partial [Terracidiphilus sp.]